MQLVFLWAISLKDKVWSNVAPKYFTDVVDLIVKLLKGISILGLHFIFWGESNRMDYVLLRWSESHQMFLVYTNLF